MSQNEASAAYRFALSAISQLAGSGVRVLVASPGFRNSPLLLAAHKTPGIEVLTAVDERGAGFLALGVARASHAPVAVLCTSGTAVGNYLPAVMEAAHSQIPLVVLTADRPQELVGTGANQCTDQAKIFGSHVRFFADTAPPSGAPHENRHAGYLIGRAVSRALQPYPGPVHVNLRFREPFLPSAEECARLESEARPQAWSFLGSVAGPTQEQAGAIGSLLKEAKRPLILLGPAALSPRQLSLLAKISARSGIPVLAEAASGFAFVEGAEEARLLHRAEPALEAMAGGRLQAPDLFIRVGAPLTGRLLSQLLAAAKLPQLVFEDWGEAREPGLHPSVMVEGGLEAWLNCGAAWEHARADYRWAQELTAFDETVETSLDTHLAKSNSLTEWHFQRSWEKGLGEEACLFLGNSMPIRDFNSVFTRSKKRLRVFSNRGLSGIDGLIATAAGVAFSSGKETHALIGDLSTLHDLPSLALLSSLRDRIHFTLWVINNGGGEIFRIVQTAKSGGRPEWFTTPQEYDLAALAKGFRLPFLRVASLSDLAALDSEVHSQPGARIIEVLADREQNLSVRKTFTHGA